MSKGMTSPNNDLQAQYRAQTSEAVNDIYLKAFPNNQGSVLITSQAEKKRGRSRLLTDANGAELYIHERYGLSARNYLHFELLKNTETGQPGWLDNEKYAVDYMAFIHLADGIMFKTPWDAMQETWAQNRDAWMRGYIEDAAWNPGYDTTFLKVPARVFMRACPQCKAIPFAPFAPEVLDAIKGRGKFKKGGKPILESLGLFDQRQAL